ncbi:MAG: CHC2 zinc finger domain-containing protein [Chloroflexota bacterium]|nr:CHC2 zinc finger domain-containing protein [Chloroflexota bacterium]
MALSIETLSETIKGAITVLEFVSQYVPLSSSGKGQCPCHDDQWPSFSVNDKAGYWHCFAGCGGGSIIDFWQKWRSCDFTTTVTELAEMLL